MRPQVTSVAVTLSDGRTLTLDASNLEGLFWSDRTVNEMLGPFYNTFDMQITPAHLVGSEAALPVLRGQSSVAITPALVDQLWNAADSKGNLPTLMKKAGPCVPIPLY
jgi:hypothetical protein